FPRESSTIIRGIDQINKKRSQIKIKAPLPFCAAILGKRQILPAPTAIPIMEKIKPSLEEKWVEFLLITFTLIQ
ncbi:hypothetical protein CP061683_0784B, partial [Chlamydia psittaci 06-1683]